MRRRTVVCDVRTRVAHVLTVTQINFIYLLVANLHTQSEVLCSICCFVIYISQI